MPGYFDMEKLGLNFNKAFVNDERIIYADLPPEPEEPEIIYIHRELREYVPGYPMVKFVQAKDGGDYVTIKQTQNLRYEIRTELYHLLLENKFVDTRIRCKDGLIFVHLPILISTKSGYFTSIKNYQYLDVGQRLYNKLSKSKSYELRVIVELMYTGISHYVTTYQNISSQKRKFLRLMNTLNLPIWNIDINKIKMHKKSMIMMNEPSLVDGAGFSVVKVNDPKESKVRVYTITDKTIAEEKQSSVYEEMVVKPILVRKRLTSDMLLEKSIKYQRLEDPNPYDQFRSHIWNKSSTETEESDETVESLPDLDEPPYFVPAKFPNSTKFKETNKKNGEKPSEIPTTSKKSLSTATNEMTNENGEKKSKNDAIELEIIEEETDDDKTDYFSDGTSNMQITPKDDADNANTDKIQSPLPLTPHTTTTTPSSAETTTATTQPEINQNSDQNSENLSDRPTLSPLSLEFHKFSDKYTKNSGNDNNKLTWNWSYLPQSLNQSDKVEKSPNSGETSPGKNQNFEQIRIEVFEKSQSSTPAENGDDSRSKNVENMIQVDENVTQNEKIDSQITTIATEGPGTSKISEILKGGSKVVNLNENLYYSRSLSQILRRQPEIEPEEINLVSPEPVKRPETPSFDNWPSTSTSTSNSQVVVTPDQINDLSKNSTTTETTVQVAGNLENLHNDQANQNQVRELSNLKRSKQLQLFYNPQLSVFPVPNPDIVQNNLQIQKNPNPAPIQPPVQNLNNFCHGNGYGQPAAVQISRPNPGILEQQFYRKPANDQNCGNKNGLKAIKSKSIGPKQKPGRKRVSSSLAVLPVGQPNLPPLLPLTSVQPPLPMLLPPPSRYQKPHGNMVQNGNNDANYQYIQMGTNGGRVCSKMLQKNQNQMQMQIQPYCNQMACLVDNSVSFSGGETIKNVTRYENVTPPPPDHDQASCSDIQNQPQDLTISKAKLLAANKSEREYFRLFELGKNMQNGNQQVNGGNHNNSIQIMPQNHHQEQQQLQQQHQMQLQQQQQQQIQQQLVVQQQNQPTNMNFGQIQWIIANTLEALRANNVENFKNPAVNVNYRNHQDQEISHINDDINTVNKLIQRIYAKLITESNATSSIIANANANAKGPTKNNRK